MYVACVKATMPNGHFCMPIRIPQIQVDPLGRYLIIEELANVVDIRNRAAGVACVRVPVFGGCFEAGINVTRGALAAYRVAIQEPI